MIQPYRVETSKRINNGGSVISDYAIFKIGEGPVLHGYSLSFMYDVADLLNKEALRDHAARNKVQVRPMLKGVEPDHPKYTGHKQKRAR